MRAPAVPSVLSLTVLPNDDPVEVSGLDVAKGRLGTGEDTSPPHVGVLVERLADRETQFPQRNMVCHIRRTDGSEAARKRGRQYEEKEEESRSGERTYRIASCWRRMSR